MRKMNNCPIEPVSEKRRMSRMTVGWELMKERTEERALKGSRFVPRGVGMRKEGVRNVG